MFLKHIRRSGLVALLSLGLVAGPAGVAPTIFGSTEAAAEPPPWAPAHGYRAKHGHKGKGKHKGGHAGQYDHAYTPRTFGVPGGHCNRELLGQVLGGAAGAAAGSQVGSGSGQTAAIIGGAIIGTLIGGEIGRAMDEVDQNCVGQVLEHAETGQTVTWQNPDASGGYAVTPRRTYQRQDGRYCREYTARSTIGGEARTVQGVACRQPDGTWELVS